jgi:hypothetical protein
VILNDIISTVRSLVQDETVPYRYTDAFLLGQANQGLKRIQLLRPDLFATIGTVACAQGEVVHSTPSDSLRLIEVHSVVGGNRLVEVNRESLDQNVPSWPVDTEAAAINWMRNPRSPNSFYIYPPAPAGQSLNVEYSQIPPTYDGTTTVTLLTDAFIPALVDVVVFLVESIDNEHVTSGRAKMFQELFLTEMGRTVSYVPVTDTEYAGQPKIRTSEVT